MNILHILRDTLVVVWLKSPKHRLDDDDDDDDIALVKEVTNSIPHIIKSNFMLVGILQGL